MMVARVEVISLEPGVAMVRPLPPSGCGGCQAGSLGCGSRTLDSTVPKAWGQRTLQLPVSLPLQVGQPLEVGIKSTTVLRLALLVYLCPLMGLLSGALLLEWLRVHEGWVACGALITASSCWVGVRSVVAHCSPQLTPCFIISRSLICPGKSPSSPLEIVGLRPGR